jgi:hypothetical protein
LRRKPPGYWRSRSACRQSSPTITRCFVRNDRLRRPLCLVPVLPGRNPFLAGQYVGLKRFRTRPNEGATT